MTTLTYRIRSTENDGKKSVGQLIWGEDSYGTVSGPWGRGTAPSGDYDIEKSRVVSNSDLEAGYCIVDSQGKLCFFIPVSPRFHTDRNGLGIHPDGNVPGSLGCLVIQADHARRFWTKWTQTSLADQPDRLTIL